MANLTLSIPDEVLQAARPNVVYRFDVGNVAKRRTAQRLWRERAAAPAAVIRARECGGVRVVNPFKEPQLAAHEPRAVYAVQRSGGKRVRARQGATRR